MVVLIFVLRAARWLVIADAVLSWVQPPDAVPRSFTKALLDPIYAPLRSVLQPLTGPIDLTPLLVLLALFFAERSLSRSRAAGTD